MLVEIARAKNGKAAYRNEVASLTWNGYSAQAVDCPCRDGFSRVSTRGTRVCKNGTRGLPARPRISRRLLVGDYKIQFARSIVAFGSGGSHCGDFHSLSPTKRNLQQHMMSTSTSAARAKGLNGWVASRLVIGMPTATGEALFRKKTSNASVQDSFAQHKHSDLACGEAAK
jgi:hypothetical protein